MPFGSCHRYLPLRKKSDSNPKLRIAAVHLSTDPYEMRTSDQVSSGSHTSEVLDSPFSMRSLTVPPAIRNYCPIDFLSVFELAFPFYTR
ncbi:hypothetical protein B296_00006672 [Ensete ventricosum]|uniref:Uncharacterized protein n=1 Tax=Ensete ventricosum TaxID=4639 RepID=A0A426ZV04_ENSVE|nr:hypothetical protein B296_00006672 [Ensete ventricosum]